MFANSLPPGEPKVVSDQLNYKKQHTYIDRQTNRQIDVFFNQFEVFVKVIIMFVYSVV